MHEVPRVLILGLGNTILTDDAVGVLAARATHQEAAALGIDVAEAEVAGFALLDLLRGYEAAVVVDAVRIPGLDPGEIVVFDPAETTPSLHLVAAHQIDLPNALLLGEELGMEMPRTARVVGVQIVDDRTFGESCTPHVARSIQPAAEIAIELAREMLNESR